jgi:hypothetical protein
MDKFSFIQINRLHSVSSRLNESASCITVFFSFKSHQSTALCQLKPLSRNAVNFISNNRNQNRQKTIPGQRSVRCHTHLSFQMSLETGFCPTPTSYEPFPYKQNLIHALNKFLQQPTFHGRHSEDIRLPRFHAIYEEYFKSNASYLFPRKLRQIKGA